MRILRSLLRRCAGVPARPQRRPARWLATKYASALKSGSSARILRRSRLRAFGYARELRLAESRVCRCCDLLRRRRSDVGAALECRKISGRGVPAVCNGDHRHGRDTRGCRSDRRSTGRTWEWTRIAYGIQRNAGTAICPRSAARQGTAAAVASNASPCQREPA